MPVATTDSFLEGQGIPVDLPNIEIELAKLWGPAAERVGGPDLENPHVTRIVLANLVVECLDGDGESLGPVLETVIARFPCRAIVVRGSDDQNRRITAEVSALCHLPAPGLPQVCSERILLRAGPNAIDLVPGAVRPLLRPTYRWCFGGPATRGGTRCSSATWPTSARGWSSTCPTLAPAPALSVWGSTEPSARAAATAPGSGWLGGASWSPSSSTCPAATTG